MDTSERLKILRETLNYNQNQLAVFLGTNNSIVSQYEKGKSRPGKKYLALLKSKIPNLNEAWLMFGQGEMFLGKIIEMPDRVLETTPAYFKRDYVKVYNRVKAGLPVAMWDNEEFAIEVSHPKLEKVKDEKYGFVVDGDSMLPRFRNGDIIIGTQVRLPDEKPKHRDFVVTFFSSDPETQNANLKLLNWINQDKTEFVLKPLNTYYDDTMHTLKEVRKMFKVLCSVSFIDYKEKIR